MDRKKKGGLLGRFRGGGEKSSKDTKAAAGEASMDELAMRDAFDKFDKNKDGAIDKQELSDLLMEYLGLPNPPTDRQLGRIMSKVDLNNDGRIQYNEFKVMMTMRNNTKNQYLEIFNNFDTNGDGYITREELEQSMRQVHPDTDAAEIDSIMASLDVSKCL